MTKLQENIVEISRSAQYLIEMNNIDIDDSKQLSTRIISWAEDFEQQNSNVDYDVELGPTGEPRDYYIEIDEFATNKMKKFYFA